ncbi:hypothetical protein [Desulfonatronovibrio hydrogenovorans]|uniref:hypothetical protein n=1 Tax=Desulfonatronovibrio hydrogenovorans TaxID=53245 RepID=UPI00068C24E5|nr:hypothetical protein [Desulfonatronovibrio hydrogenovorans]
MKKAFFLLIYTVLGVWGQFALPSVDFLTPALVVLLQLGFFSYAFWAGLFWMLIQEGAGDLAFGTAILFYSGLLIFFFTGGAFFEVSNILFSLFLFLFLSIYKPWIVTVMASLQDLSLTGQYSLQGMAIQWGVYFCLWCLTYNLCKKYFVNESVQGK